MMGNDSSTVWIACGFGLVAGIESVVAEWTIWRGLGCKAVRFQGLRMVRVDQEVACSASIADEN